MKIIKTYITFILLFTPIHIFSYEKINSDIINIKIGHCKAVSLKKIIQISSSNKSVLSVEKDYLTNKICLKGKKVGSSIVNMILLDGNGSVTWYVQVIRHERKLKMKRKMMKQEFNFSQFDKHVGIPYHQPGWQ